MSRIVAPGEESAGVRNISLHRLLESLQCRGEVGKLPVEIFLALGLFLQLVNRGEVDLAELLDVTAHLRQ